MILGAWRGGPIESFRRLRRTIDLIGGPAGLEPATKTVMSDGIMVGFVDFAVLSFAFGRVCWRFDEIVSGAKLVRWLGAGTEDSSRIVHLACFWNLRHERANGFETCFLLVLPSRLDVQFGKVGLQVVDANAGETADEVVFLGSNFV
jgi:hypothetical protein